MKVKEVIFEVWLYFSLQSFYEPKRHVALSLFNLGSKFSLEF